jgi:hypothetical protein
LRERGWGRGFSAIKRSISFYFATTIVNSPKE